MRTTQARAARSHSASIGRHPTGRRFATALREALDPDTPIQRKSACSCGGGCPKCIGTTIQTKLTIGAANDQYEREADQVADKVMRMPESQVQRVAENGEEEEQEVQARLAGDTLVQRQEAVEDSAEEAAPASVDAVDPLAGEPEGLDPVGSGESVDETPTSGEEALQTKPTANRAATRRPAPSSGFAARLRGAASSGRPLPAATRTFMESRFGTDFGAVRVHHDQRSDTLSRQTGALAFTQGRNVFFRNDSYAPHSEHGRRLLAHELTHVIQQGAASNIRRKPAGSGLGASVSRLGDGAGRLQRAVEVHVNLRHGSGRLQTVRLHDSTSGSRDFTTSAGTGTRTSRLIRRRHYGITNKVGPPPAKSYRWGLQYFCPFHGGIGFHSRIAFPLRSTLCADGVRRFCRSGGNTRVRWPLIVDGTPRSHGCLRLSHGNSRRLFNAVAVGTRVYVYDRRNWRPPSWSSAPDRALP